MKKIALLLLSVYLFTSCHTQPTETKLNELIEAYTKQYKFNGTVLVAKGDKILLQKGYGFQNVAAKTMNSPDVLFQIGSITKQFTATIILKLQEQKKLDVQDKLSKFFPSYPKGDSITIHQLLTHTSGIYSYTSDGEFMKNKVDKPATRESMMALFKDKPLQFSPGSKWEYSNSGYVLLGYIIEDATGKPYEQVVREYIFSPLQMTQSGFDFTHLRSTEKATGYFQLVQEPATVAPIVDSSVAYSAGSIYSTTTDLYKWYKGMLANRIITAASKEKAFTPVENKYGYGWNIDSVYGKRKLEHSGGIHGFTSNMLVIPEEGVCIILLNNVSNPHLSEITNKLLAVLYDKPYELPKERIAITLSADVLEQYTGIYELSPSFSIKMTVKDGMLTGQPTGQPPSALFAEKKDFFFLKVVEAQVEFKRDESGNVTSLVLHQNGRETPGKKIN